MSRQIAAVETPLSPVPFASMAAGTPNNAPLQVKPSQQAYVQIGAFSQLANAQRSRDQTINLGPVSIVQSATAEGNPLYRVVLGPIASRAEADLRAQEIVDSGVAGARVMASLN